MNIRRLRRVQKLILKHHDKLNMQIFSVGSVYNFNKNLKKRKKNMDCGFAGCIVGFTVGAYGDENQVSVFGWTLENMARRILDIPNGDLFIPETWPTHLQTEDCIDTSKWHKIPATHVSKVIDDYIATKGWPKD